MTVKNFCGAWVHTHNDCPPDVGNALIKLAGCCYGSAEYGPAACTCWDPVYDLDQRPAVLAGIETRTEPCADCAYRPDSPERTGDERYAHGDVLDELPGGDTPFWCHQGMRKPVAWKHPCGITVVATTDAYDPPQITAVGRRIPLKANGRPADMCFGWAARAELVKRSLENSP